MTGSETILLVEDAAPLRHVTRELVERSGHTVLAAADGKQAIAIADQSQGAHSFLRSLTLDLASDSGLCNIAQ